jgi:hypothetical protein
MGLSTNMIRIKTMRVNSMGRHHRGSQNEMDEGETFMRRYALLILLVVLLVLPMPVLAETVSPTSGTANEALSGYTPDELLQQWYQIGALLRENGNYPYVELSKGNSGYEVIALQTRLAELKYYQKEIASNYGSGTYNAMRAFEKANDLAVNGVASVEDQQVLFSSMAVAYSGGKVTTDNGGKGNAGSDATSAATSN